MDKIIIAIIVLLIILLLIWYIKTLNKIRVKKVKVEEALSGIDVALQQRYDVLTKMIDVVKSFKEHEKETFVEIVKIRSDMSIEAKENSNKQMDEAFNQIKLIAENYPELRSSENYQNLQESISKVEEDLKISRKLYNDSISKFNETVVTFPNIIVAKTSGNGEKKFFEVAEDKKEDVKINL